MSAYLPFIIHGQSFVLSANRSLYWEATQTLIVSDCHLGKTGHFRKSGIAMPQAVFKEDMQRLVQEIQFFKPQQLVVIGDMFHSHANKELDFFLKWRNDFAQLSIQLVQGNHDILSKDWYQQAHIHLVPAVLQIGNIQLVHDLKDQTIESGSFTFSGHVHAGIVIKGLGKQSLRFPCFYITPQYAILPAFSKFTGSYALTSTKQDRVVAIVENSLIAIQ